jgi:hypothetical protein
MPEHILRPEHGSHEQRLAKRERTSSDVKNADVFHHHPSGSQVKSTAIHHGGTAKQHDASHPGEGSIIGSSRQASRPVEGSYKL